MVDGKALTKKDALIGTKDGKQLGVKDGKALRFRNLSTVVGTPIVGENDGNTRVDPHQRTQFFSYLPHTPQSISSQ